MGCVAGHVGKGRSAWPRCTRRCMAPWPRTVVSAALVRAEPHAHEIYSTLRYTLQPYVRRRRRRRRLYSSVPHLGQHRPATVQMCPRHHACAAPRVSTTTSRTLNERAPTRAPGDHTAPLSPGIRLVSVTLHARPRDAAAPHRHARGLWPRAARAAPCEMARERDRRRIGRGRAGTPQGVGSCWMGV